MKYFDFSEALSCINCDMPVSIKLGGKVRTYYRKNGKIMCRAGISEYVVNHFYTDAIESNKWYLAYED